jgi:predicted P-loop ATPase
MINASQEHKMKDIHLQLDTFFAENYDLRFNVLNEQNEFRLKGTEGPFRLLTPRELNGIAINAYRFGVDCIDCDIRRYLNSPLVDEYNPIMAYLDALPAWDGKDRITTFARRVDTSTFWLNKFHLWMLSMVAQWMELSTKFGNCLMPILISPEQGKHKSTFCRSILPPELRAYYTDDFDLDSHASVARKMVHYALINIDELNRLSEQKMAKLKTILQRPDLAMVSRDSISFTSRKRMASFIGTSNFKELLTDPTGSRREVPIVVKNKIRYDHVNYARLYAQLKEELLRGVRYWMTSAEEARLKLRNAAFCRRPVEESLFFSCFRLPGKTQKSLSLSLTQLYETLKRKSAATMRDISLSAFSTHLSMMGVVKRHTRLGTVCEVVKA